MEEFVSRVRSCQETGDWLKYMSCHKYGRSGNPVVQCHWRSNVVGRVGKIYADPNARVPELPGKEIKNNFPVTVKLRHLDIKH